MSDLIKCDKCNGQKKVYGFGGIQKSCPDCKGLGFTKEKIEIETKTENVVTPSGELVVVKKKPGRKPRIQTVLEV